MCVMRNKLEGGRKEEKGKKEEKRGKHVCVCVCVDDVNP